MAALHELGGESRLHQDSVVRNFLARLFVKSELAQASV